MGAVFLGREGQFMAFKMASKTASQGAFFASNYLPGSHLVLHWVFEHSYQPIDLT